MRQLLAGELGRGVAGSLLGKLDGEFLSWLSGREPDSYLRRQVGSLTPLSGLRISCGCELWPKSQIRLRSQHCCGCGVDHRCGSDPVLLRLWCNSSDSTRSLGTPICCSCGPKKRKKEKGKDRLVAGPSSAVGGMVLGAVAN